jgi:hypothetical protein
MLSELPLTEYNPGEIIKHKLNRGRVGYSAFYQTPETRELDEMFGLKGEPVDEFLIEFGLQSPSKSLFDDVEQQETMRYFSRIAGSLGNFVGVPFDEMGKVIKSFPLSFVEKTIKNGYLELFRRDGVLVVAPTTKYKPSRLSP